MVEKIDTSKYYWVTVAWKALMAQIRKIKADNAAKRAAKKAAEKAAEAVKPVEVVTEEDNAPKVHPETGRIK